MHLRFAWPVWNKSRFLQEQLAKQKLKDNKEAENEDCDVSKLFFFFLKL